MNEKQIAELAVRRAKDIKCEINLSNVAERFTDVQWAERVLALASPPKRGPGIDAEPKPETYEGVRIVALYRNGFVITGPIRRTPDEAVAAWNESVSRPSIT